MKNHTHLISFAAGTIACATLGLGLGLARTGVTVQPDEPEMPSMAEMMAMMAEAGALGEQHAELAKNSGNWHASASFLDPGGDPITGEGSAQTKVILGGRYTMTEFHLDDFMGQPFDGIAIMGYDNLLDQYSSVWMDSMSTHMYTSTGQMSADGTLTMEGHNINAMGESEMRMVTTFGEGAMTDTFHEKHPGMDWINTGTITYTRAKKSDG